MTRWVHRTTWQLAGAVIFTALLAALTGSTAWAAPVWRLDADMAPTYLQPGKEGQLTASASNLSTTPVTPSAAHPLKLIDRLPAGLEVPAGVTGAMIANDETGESMIEVYGHEAAEKLESCTVEEAHRREVTCMVSQAAQALASYGEMSMRFPVTVLPGAASGEANEVEVVGGEAGGGEVPAPPPLVHAITVKDESTPFGIERYELTPENEDGTFDSRAGSHPFQLTTTLDLNETLAQELAQAPTIDPATPALVKNLDVELPPGLLGDPLAVPRCSDADFSTIGSDNENACPPSTAVGVAIVRLNLPIPTGLITQTVPVFNLEPEEGEPARFGFEDAKVPVILDTSVRTNGDYGVDVDVSNTTQVAELLNARVTFWGDPDSPSHDSSRGWACVRGTEANGETCTPLAADERSQTPFLTLPTSCSGALIADLEGSSWPIGEGGPATSKTLHSSYELQKTLEEPLAQLEGCQQVPFEPSLSMYPVEQHEAPQTPEELVEEQHGHAPRTAVNAASTPAGMNVRVAFPAEGEARGEPGVELGESAVRATTVTLPEGVQLNPSAANGLQACTEGQAGYEGEGHSPDPRSPGTPEPLRFSSAKAQCPPASKIGIVHIKVPELERELEGGVYLAQQEANPFHSLFALYIVAEDKAAGVRAKLAGEVKLDEQSGRITTTFENTPQVAFEELRLHFFEGPHASLGTPPLCGSYPASSAFTSWSGLTLEPETQPLIQIASGPGGGPCPSNPLPFQPSFTAGATSAQAGAFTPFTVVIGRPDEDQPLTGVTVHLPAGIAALLAKVTPCKEPPVTQEWACGPESLIGHSTASSGLGPEPYTLPGTVYLTTGYDGAPFGLLVQTPAVAGPFNLGIVNVRSRIDVNPETAAVTITTDPGPRNEALPTHLKGVPAQIKQIAITVDRPEFEFNPTSCEAKSIDATLTGASGALATGSSPFRATNCASLSFAPRLTALAGAHGSKLDGTSFDVKIESGGVGAAGLTQANIAKVDLQLPLALSSRLPTLQKACTEAVFDANPASCDEGSVIGTATVHTPVLRSPLTGPAYLVSHGNAAFPDVEFVLQGEGIELVLDGKTDIKAGVTYSKFESAPDAPFTSFETELPAGPHSILGPNVPEKEHYSLCKANLTMPTTITAQDGAVIEQNTQIAAIGCGGVEPFKKTKLDVALEACRKHYKNHKRKRVACEKRARKKYGPKRPSTSAHHKAAERKR